MTHFSTPTLTIRGTLHPRFAEILTPDALDFLAKLDAAFAGRRAELLSARRDRAQAIAEGKLHPDFLPETASIRADPGWRVAPVAPGLADRRCEITGPPTPKMTVNALNSGARVWMADFEDATAPSWANVIAGQLTLRDAVRRELQFTDDGKDYRIGAEIPTIVVRPRGLRLCEKHITSHGRPLPAAFVDFGLFMFHNARDLIESGTGPYFYLPKLESHFEARLWNDVFVFAQELLGIPRGTIRATVLIETLPAAFEMEEILYELREHSSGLNAGRWDYIFSFIKTFAYSGEQYVLPDRSQVSMTTPFMRAYTELLVSTCHRRGAHAIGGMAAFVPTKSDPAGARTALAKVRDDKNREAADGFDGSWVAHPALVRTCTEAFDAVLGERPDQRDRLRPEVRVHASDLTTAPQHARASLDGVRTDVSVALRYLASWVAGSGAVAIDSLMEDAATVEISRAQLWQWIHYGTQLAEGPKVTREMVSSMIDEEVELLEREGEYSPLDLAAARDVLGYAALSEEMHTFFTPYAYVRYLTDKPLQMTGPLQPEDLRMSERVNSSSAGDPAEDAA